MWGEGGGLGKGRGGAYEVGQLLELGVGDVGVGLGHDGLELGEEGCVDLGVVDDVEEGDGVGDAGGVVACRDGGEDLVFEAFSSRHGIAFLRDGDEETFHDRWEGGVFALFFGGDELVDSAVGELG